MVLQARSSLNKSDGVDGSGERKTIINVEVFYIDFGNIESLGVENLRDLLPRFMELPAQVVRCSLADVEPLAKCTAGPDEVFVGKCFLLLFGWFFNIFYQIPSNQLTSVYCSLHALTHLPTCTYAPTYMHLHLPTCTYTPTYMHLHTYLQALTHLPTYTSQHNRHYEIRLSETG